MFYYKQITANKIVSIEVKSIESISPGFIRATKAEYDNFIASLPAPVIIPPRDLAAEIDGINARLITVEGMLELMPQ